MSFEDDEYWDEEYNEYSFMPKYAVIQERHFEKRTAPDPIIPTRRPTESDELAARRARRDGEKPAAPFDAERPSWLDDPDFEPIDTSVENLSGGYFDDIDFNRPELGLDFDKPDFPIVDPAALQNPERQRRRQPGDGRATRPGERYGPRRRDDAEQVDERGRGRDDRRGEPRGRRPADPRDERWDDDRRGGRREDERRDGVEPRRRPEEAGRDGRWDADDRGRPVRDGRGGKDLTGERRGSGPIPPADRRAAGTAPVDDRRGSGAIPVDDRRGGGSGQRPDEWDNRPAARREFGDERGRGPAGPAWEDENFGPIRPPGGRRPRREDEDPRRGPARRGDQPAVSGRAQVPAADDRYDGRGRPQDAELTARGNGRLRDDDFGRTRDEGPVRGNGRALDEFGRELGPDDLARSNSRGRDDQRGRVPDDLVRGGRARDGVARDERDAARGDEPVRRVRDDELVRGNGRDELVRGNGRDELVRGSGRDRDDELVRGTGRGWDGTLDDEPVDLQAPSWDTVPANADWDGKDRPAGQDRAATERPGARRDDRSTGRDDDERGEPVVLDGEYYETPGEPATPAAQQAPEPPTGDDGKPRVLRRADPPVLPKVVSKATPPPAPRVLKSEPPVAPRIVAAPQPTPPARVIGPGAPQVPVTAPAASASPTPPAPTPRQQEPVGSAADSGTFVAPRVSPGSPPVDTNRPVPGVPEASRSRQSEPMSGFDRSVTGTEPLRTAASNGPRPAGGPPHTGSPWQAGTPAQTGRPAPAQPAAPWQAGPGNPAGPGQAAGPWQPGDSDPAAGPWQSGDPSQPVDPWQSGDPSQAAGPWQSGDPSRPGGPWQSGGAGHTGGSAESGDAWQSGVAAQAGVPGPAGVPGQPDDQRRGGVPGRQPVDGWAGQSAVEPRREGADGPVRPAVPAPNVPQQRTGRTPRTAHVFLSEGDGPWAIVPDEAPPMPPHVTGRPGAPVRGPMPANRPTVPMPGAGQPPMPPTGPIPPNAGQPVMPPPGLVAPQPGQPVAGPIAPNSGQPIAPRPNQPVMPPPGLVTPQPGQPVVPPPGLVTPQSGQPVAPVTGPVTPNGGQPATPRPNQPAMPPPGLVTPQPGQPVTPPPGLVTPQPGQPVAPAAGPGLPAGGRPVMPPNVPGTHGAGQETVTPGGRTAFTPGVRPHATQPAPGQPSAPVPASGEGPAAPPVSPAAQWDQSQAGAASGGTTPGYQGIPGHRWDPRQPDSGGGQLPGYQTPDDRPVSPAGQWVPGQGVPQQPQAAEAAQWSAVPVVPGQPPVSEPARPVSPAAQWTPVYPGSGQAVPGQPRTPDPARPVSPASHRAPVQPVSGAEHPVSPATPRGPVQHEGPAGHPVSPAAQPQHGGPAGHPVSPAPQQQHGWSGHPVSPAPQQAQAQHGGVTAGPVPAGTQAGGPGQAAGGGYEGGHARQGGFPGGDRPTGELPLTAGSEEDGWGPRAGQRPVSPVQGKAWLPAPRPVPEAGVPAAGGGRSQDGNPMPQTGGSEGWLQAAAGNGVPAQHHPGDAPAPQPPANGLPVQPPASGMPPQPPANGLPTQPPANALPTQPPANALLVQPPHAGAAPGQAGNGSGPATGPDGEPVPYMDPDGTLHNLKPIGRLAVSGPDQEPRRYTDNAFGSGWFVAKVTDPKDTEPGGSGGETEASAGEPGGEEPPEQAPDVPDDAGERGDGRTGKDSGDLGKHLPLSAADLDAIRWRLDGGTLREVVDDRGALRELGERLDGPLADEADNIVKAGLLSVRAEVYRLLGELGMAAAASRLALAHAESAQDVQSMVIAQAELAHVLRLRGDWMEADRLFQRAVDSDVSAAVRSVVHENAGRSAFDQGRHMEALDHFARAIRLGAPDDTDLAERVGVCLEAVYIHVLRDGWGPYPRRPEEVLAPLSGRNPEEPLTDEPAEDRGSDAFDESTAEQAVVRKQK